MALRVASEFGIPHRTVDTAEMANPDYRANRPDRCYHCKTELFDVLGELRDRLGFDAVAYGVNTDDTSDFRPGHRAAHEHGVLSPFLDAGLSKAEIRALSRDAGLPTAELPSSACLSSRLPYGTEVTRSACARWSSARRRCADSASARCACATTATSRGSRSRATSSRARSIPRWRSGSARRCAPLGFRWVALDLDGYRTGSLNEVLAIRSEPSGR